MSPMKIDLALFDKPESQTVGSIQITSLGWHSY